MTVSPPKGLVSGGRALWKALTEANDLDAAQLVQLLEACRAKDRLDGLDDLLRGDVDTWSRLVVDMNSDGQIFELRITQALTQANNTANLMKQLLAALRLPDAESGRRPQRRGARGAQRPTVPGGATVSAIDRGRARSGA